MGGSDRRGRNGAKRGRRGTSRRGARARRTSTTWSGSAGSGWLYSFPRCVRNGWSRTGPAQGRV